MTSEFAPKLNLKPTMTVLLLNDQAGLAADLAEALGDDLSTAPVSDACDAVLLFSAQSSDLATHYAAAKPALGAETMLWVMYPKKSSGIKSDMTREQGWAVIEVDGWQGVRQISINEVWSALRYKKVADAGVRGSVDDHYSGAKAGLRPIYNRVAHEIEALGPDVSEGLVRGAYVAWSRKSHFVAVGPVGKASDAAVGVAFKFKDLPFEGRFTSSNKVGGGSFSHLVTLHTLEEVDAEFLGYLRRAYELSV